MTREEEIEAAWRLHRGETWAERLAYRTALRRRLAEAQGWRCCYCGVPMNEIRGHPQSTTLEHVVPASRGGPTEEWNLVVACLDCNGQRKDAFLEIEDQLRPLLVETIDSTAPQVCPVTLDEMLADEPGAETA